MSFMNPNVIPAAMILCAFIVLCLVVLLRFIDQELSK